MHCHRCGGLMLEYHYGDLHDHGRDTEVAGWRCVNCGAVHDPVIAGNRLGSTRTPQSLESVTPS